MVLTTSANIPQDLRIVVIKTNKQTVIAIKITFISSPSTSNENDEYIIEEIFASV